MSAGSWVIVELATGAPMFETFSAALAARVNKEKYKAIPIGEWLATVNAKAKEMKK